MGTEVTEADSELAQRIARSLLLGSGFAGFEFHTHFRLRFGSAAGAATPSCLLTIEAPWRIDTAQGWAETLTALTLGPTVEPAEPVLAYLLARMRWNTSGIVTAVEVTDQELRIAVDDEELVISSAPSVLDEAWSITEAGVPEHGGSWSLVCEAGRYYARFPAPAHP
jgi:hypothetical protein